MFLSLVPGATFSLEQPDYKGNGTGPANHTGDGDQGQQDLQSHQPKLNCFLSCTVIVIVKDTKTLAVMVNVRATDTIKQDTEQQCQKNC